MDFLKRIFGESEENSKLKNESPKKHVTRERTTVSDIKKNNLTTIGEINRCPYCKKKLDKIPQKKKKCEHCQNYIFVRTEQSTQKKILLTEKQKEDMEMQVIADYEKQERDRQLSDPEFIKAKQELKQKFGREPLFNDIRWKIFNQRILEYSVKKEWESYKENLWDMANLLEKEEKYKQALVNAFEVFYLELNGPNNITTYKNLFPTPEAFMKSKIKEFDLKKSFINPIVIDFIEGLIEQLDISKDEAKCIFINSNTLNLKNNEQYTNHLKEMPISPEVAWNKLSDKINHDQKIKNLKVTDNEAIFLEIDRCIKNKENYDAINLIRKLNKLYSSKKKISNPKKLKVFVSGLLKSEERSISSLAEALLIILIKKDKNEFEDLAEDYVKQIKNNFENYVQSHIIGKLASINIEWVKPMIPKLIKLIKEGSEWNLRRFAAFNIGHIGSSNPELIQEAIPIIINFIKDPYTVAKKQNLNITAMLIDDPVSWLKDAYIDSLSMVAKRDKSLIEPYKPLFEQIAKKDKSEYSRKKAQNILELLQ